MLVRDLHAEVPSQLLDRRVHGCRVGELGEHHEAHGQEGGRARDRAVDGRENTVGVLPHVGPREGILEIGLAGGGGVADGIRHLLPPWVASSSGHNGRLTTRVS